MQILWLNFFSLLTLLIIPELHVFGFPSWIYQEHSQFSLFLQLFHMLKHSGGSSENFSSGLPAWSQSIPVFALLEFLLLFFYHRLCYILNSCPYFLCLSQVPEIQEEESLVYIFFSVVFLAHHSMSDKQLMLSNGWLNEYQLRSKSHVFQSLPCISYSSEVSISDVIHYIPEN